MPVYQWKIIITDLSLYLWIDANKEHFKYISLWSLMLASFHRLNSCDIFMVEVWFLLMIFYIFHIQNCSKVINHHYYQYDLIIIALGRQGKQWVIGPNFIFLFGFTSTTHVIIVTKCNSIHTHGIYHAVRNHNHNVDVTKIIIEINICIPLCSFSTYKSPN